MEAIIEALKEELSKYYSSITVQAFAGFVRNNSHILWRLNHDFDAGVNFCKEIIEYSRR
jgi:hypothetical protein